MLCHSRPGMNTVDVVSRVFHSVCSPSPPVPDFLLVGWSEIPFCVIRGTVPPHKCCLLPFSSTLVPRQPSMVPRQPSMSCRFGTSLPWYRMCYSFLYFGLKTQLSDSCPVLRAKRWHQINCTCEGRQTRRGSFRWLE